MNTVRKKVALKLYDSVVRKTPVDTGRARANWQISIGYDETREVDRTDQSSAMKTEEEKLGSVNGDDKIYIVNNLPYITKLEYGGYSKDSKTGKTVNGYSKQAPNGMVGVTMANFQKHIADAIKESGFSK